MGLTLLRSSGYNFTMAKARLFFACGVWWEFVRFTVFFYLAASSQFQTSLKGTDTLLVLMLFGCGQLVIPAGYFLLLLDSKKYSQYIQLLRIGKTLALLVSLLIVAKDLFADRAFFQLGTILVSDKRYLILILASIFFDLIFLYILLSYKIDGNEKPEGDPDLKERGEAPIFNGEKKNED